MKNMLISSLILGVFILAPILPAQIRIADFKIHDRGRLWETMKDDGTIGAPEPTNQYAFFPSMDWPGGPTDLVFKDDQRSYMVAAGMWIGGRHQDGTLFFTENGPFTLVDDGTFEEIVEQENFIESPGYDPNQAEETIIAAWATSENIRIDRTSRAWSFQGLNNFIIMEYVVTNQNPAQLTDVFIGFPYLIRPSYQDFLAHNGWGDDFNRTDERVAYDTSRALLYAYDDAPNFDLPNDLGNYWADADEMRTPGYAGYALLEADPAADARSQPANVFFAQLLSNENLLTSNSNSKQNMYAILNGSDRALQAPDTLLTPFMLMSFGPYTIAPSGQVKISIVEAVNGIPIEEAVEGLVAQPLLPAGLDSLKNTIDRARQLFSNNYQLSAVAPPSPVIEILPLPTTQQISITWDPIDETWENPISGLEDFKQYNVYRADRTFIGPYTLIRKIRPASLFDRGAFFKTDLNKWQYLDSDISLGVGYFYAVTGMDESNRESWLTNRNEEAIKAISQPSENALNVKVFPNPFRQVSGFPTRGEENTIVWTNLPARATIRIYTSSGELIKVLEHQAPAGGDATGDEVWDQLTDARQQISPGIYYWTVTSEVGNAKGTLLLIK